MDVIYMENTECFEIINRLSVRIAKNGTEQLKGSGIFAFKAVWRNGCCFYSCTCGD